MLKISSNFNESLNDDFIEILSRTEKIWKKSKKKIFLLTGCTGFFGYWLVRSFIEANKKYNLNIKLFILTRNKNNLINKLLKDKIINFIIGDIRNFNYPKNKIDYIIHGATTSALETFNKQNPLEKISIIVDGTKNILNLTKKNKCKKFLYLSSGSVYGKEFKLNKKMKESDVGNLNHIDSNLDLSVLGQSKKMAETLVSIYSKTNNISSSIARCFTFVGPLLPLDIHYAIGNFLKNKVSNKNILINSTGESIRSFMYMTDLTVWLLSILFFGKNDDIYNVGSDKGVSIKKLAKMVNNLEKNNSKIKIKKITRINDKNSYVPSVSKSKKILNLKIKYNLKESLKKTYLNLVDNKSFYSL